MMNKIKYIAIILTILILIPHVGCMTTKTPAPGGLSGIVTDMAGNLISAVTISTTEGNAVTDVYGRWSIQGLSPKIIDVKAEHDRYEPQTITVEVETGKFVEDVNFALAEKGELSNFKIQSLSSTKVVVTFNTKYAAKGYVEYGTDGLLSHSTIVEPRELYSHKFEIDGLVPATTYRFRCVIIDEFGRTVKSQVKNLTTNYTSRPNPPVDLKIESLKGSAVIQLSWRENTTTDFEGFNVYRAIGANGLFEKKNRSPLMQAGFGDSALEPGVKYYYKVTKVSGSGDESFYSDVASILAPGYLTKNAIWTVADSPYILTDSLTIAQGSSLTIGKGVTVKIEKSSGNEPLSGIGVHGTLVVQGTQLEPVSILSNSSLPTKKDWAGITFHNTADLTASLIKSLELYNAVKGIEGLVGGPNILDSSFYSCEEYGIKYQNGTRDVEIKNAFVENSTIGISVTDFASGKVEILNSKLLNCFTGIVSKNNQLSDVQGNKLARITNVGIELANPNDGSKARRNIVGWGSSGVGIRCLDKDEVSRNTVQSTVCIEAFETCAGIFRNNLLLTDKDKNHVGFMYNASRPYNSNTAPNRLTIEYNAIWNATKAAKKYCNLVDGSALSGYSWDITFESSPAGPALEGGSPFAFPYDLDFSYVPVKGSILIGGGYDYENIGAEDGGI